MEWIIFESNTSKVMRSNPATLFYFQTQKYFTILFKFLEFLRSLDRFKVFIRVIISEFYMAWRLNSLQYLLTIIIIRLTCTNLWFVVFWVVCVWSGIRWTFRYFRRRCQGANFARSFIFLAVRTKEKSSRKFSFVRKI